MRKERFKLIPEVHLLLFKGNKILLIRRFNTGYEDRNYSVVAGHVNGNESATFAMAREAKEEIGIIIDPKKLDLRHIIHRKGNDERCSFFFSAERWEGIPRNMETDKCDDLKWFSIDNLPSNLIEYVAHAIDCVRNHILYSEYGW